MSRTTALLCVLAATVLGPPAMAQNWTGEIYGGSTFDRTEEFNGAPLSVDAGAVFGLGVYERNLVPGVELGFDVMSTDAGYTGTGTGVESLSFMLNARVPFPITPTFTGYAGAGLGAIRVTFDGGVVAPALTGDDTVAGAQLGLGVRYNLAAFTAFAELKHQFAFDDAVILGNTQSYEATAAVVGIRFAF